jgi:tripartite-type tricarboxylate transporter receptor subunit TctC
MFSLKQWMKCLFGAACLASAAQAGAADAYPTDPIKLVVPYVAGASTDTLARMVAQDLGKEFKKPVIVENRPGAGGTIAADFLRRQPADGYTFGFTTDGIMSVNPAVYKKLNYDSLKDFTPLSIAVNAPIVLVVRADSPFKTAQELIAHAKANPESLSYGSAGLGSSQHMAGELLKSMAGVKILHVPYRGGEPAMTDLLGGQISMMFVQSASAKEFVTVGKIRILAIGSPRRNKQFPDVPTLDEIGLKGYDSDTWYGFNMPANADPKIVETLNAAIVKSLKGRQAQLEGLGYDVVASSPEDQRKNIEHNLQKWADVAKKADVYHVQ